MQLLARIYGIFLGSDGFDILFIVPCSPLNTLEGTTPAGSCLPFQCCNLSRLGDLANHLVPDSRSQDHQRADFFLSVTFLVSMTLLFFNDFLLKPSYPSAVIGILSDLVGMVFFPLLLAGIVEFPISPISVLTGRPLAGFYFNICCRWGIFF